MSIRCHTIIAGLAFLAVAAAGYPQCGDPSAGSCCELNPNFTPFCNDLDCCEIVCAINLQCCTQFWSTTCAIHAQNNCHALCGDCGTGSVSNNPCCTANATPYCYDAPCCQSVCAVDPFCCDAEGGGVWDQRCADLAWEHCPDLDGCSPPPLCPGSGDCCASGGNGSPGCSTTFCCNAVCAIDPYCCEVEWDACCVNLAVEHCSGLTGCHTPVLPEPQDHPECVGARGDCCVSNGSIGCWSTACCNLICTMDPFCCDVTWDALCVGAALSYCADCKGGPPLPPPALSCQNNCGGPASGGCWCDEACCHFGDCCEDKGDYCVGCNYGLGNPPLPGAGCLPLTCGGFGEGCWCDELCFDFADCCPNICSGCAHLAGCIPPNPADLTGNNRVGVDDLLILLANWGECKYERCFVMEAPDACPGDFNHDQAVGVDDLLFLLENWSD